MIEALAFAKAYWKQIAVVAAVLALIALGLQWLHDRDAEHYAAGQAEVQGKWNDQKKIDAEAKAKADAQTAKDDQARAAKELEDERTLQAKNEQIAQLAAAVAAGDVRMRNANAGFQRRLSELPDTAGCTAAVDAASRLADVVTDLTGRLNEGAVLARKSAALIQARETELTNDRVPATAPRSAGN